MTRIRTFLVVCAVALAIPVAIGGCGGDDSSDVDPQTVLDETSNSDTKVSSGNVSLSLSGSAGDQGSFEVKLEGPFQGDPDNPNAIPQLDWTGSLSGSGAGTSLSFDGSLIVTSDNAYIEYGGGTYEVGSDLFSQFKQAAENAAQQQGATENTSFKEACENAIGAQGGDTSACDIDFQGWLTDLTNAGTEDVEGTDSDHISGSVDVDTMLTDVFELISSLPQASSGGVPTDAQLRQIADAVSEANFDLFSTTDEHILNGLDLDLAIDPSQIPEASSAGVDSVDVSLSLRIGGINEEQTIDAPSDAQPLDDLLKQFGASSSDLGALDGLGGSTGGGGGGDAYVDCIAEAKTAAEINKCASLL